MKNNQSTGDVKRFLKEMIQLELVPALEEIVDQLPEELVGFSDPEQLLRKEFNHGSHGSTRIKRQAETFSVSQRGMESSGVTNSPKSTIMEKWLPPKPTPGSTNYCCEHLWNSSILVG